ncbi:hypothetical protein VTN77DRAFT_1977 [Rasamsonia byssochlamydoides]|uniref:uncharacterized protein n=1 Tax=Rasamsonia byssochlamydoides TaxID=89139 RepID=UPI0037448051
MPAKVTSQPTVGTAQSRMASSRTSNSSRNTDSSSGEISTRRRLQKAASTIGNADSPSSRTPSIPRSGTEPRSSMMGRRRQSIRDQKAPGPGITRSGSLHSGSSSIDTTNDSTRNHSISSTNSRISLGTSNVGNSTKYEVNQTPPEGSDFLAPINFDDFHNSIMDEPSLNNFPMPGHGGAGYDNKSNTSWSKNEGNATVRPARSGSLRRQSEVGRLTGQASSNSTSMPPPAAPASRTRHQSQISAPSSTSVASRPPRKSVGPGTLALDGTITTTDTASRRRTSISMKKASSDNCKADQGSASLRLRSQNQEPTRTDDSKLPVNSRSLKAKSLQPLSREPQENLLAPSGGHEHSRSSSTNAVRTPVKNAAGAATTPSSVAKRMSIVPHATGLGARTISPTDARRLKRMSTMPAAPPMPNTPPTQSQLDVSRPRSSAQSPSMIPRKSVTPSSSRTTPDPNRKSYSSGISLSSNTSYNSARNSGGSLQPRLSQTFSSSRLPTPKPRLENIGVSEEEVPPVPAIPKAYESPKTDLDLLTPPTARKSSFQSDVGRLSDDSRRDSDSSGQAATINSAQDDTTPTVAPRLRGSKTPDAKTGRQAASLGKKNLQPLKLPPLNLLPLSTPMAAKIDALKDGNAPEDVRASSPTLRHMVPKTPSTPLTASKASFFSSNGDDPETQPIPFPRSSTSHFLVSASSSSYRAPSSSSAIVPLEMPTANRNMSPYISSSLPKANDDYSFMPHKTSGEYSRGSLQLAKLTGPRPQTQASALSSNTEAGSRMSSPPDLEKNGSSFKNKLMKHSSSKSLLSSDNESNSAKYDNMPPPRLPASATWNNGLSSVAGSTSPTLKPAHLEARRQSSISSCTNGAKQPSVSSEQSLAPAQSPSTESGGDTETTHTRSASSILSPVHKIISSAKANVSAKPRPPDPNVDPDQWAADEEMRRLGSKRKDFEAAARELDELRRRASPKERVSPAQALKMANLNIFERGEIIDFKDIYFCGTQKAKKHVGDLKAQSMNFGYDDERGDYQIVIGDHLAYRYEIVDVLGKGSFGQVVRCVDHKTGALVAVKIIRNKKRFHQQALVEVNILQKLKEWDPHRRHSVVKFTQSFYFRGHLCIATELLGMNLYEFIKAHDFKGFSLKLIRQFTKQLLSTLVLLYNKKVIHCDLKPENILLVHPLRSDIRVIDFGSSCFEHEKVYTYIQSRFYRSPEVILGMSYGMPIDMWSLGCILAELYTGYPIFPGENEQEQLACIMEVFGPPEKHLIDKSTRRKLFFDSMGKPRVTVSSKGRRRRPSSKDLRQVLKCDDEAFVDFVARCLRWDPARRLNPNEALNHEFITGVKPSSSRSRPGSANTSTPLKRLNPGTAPSAPRPLPEPPGTSYKNGAVVKNRDASNSSPSKTSSAPRRHSTINGLQPAAGKRVSNSGSYSNSSLPRVAQRSVSGKPDLAAAAAATSLKTR